MNDRLLRILRGKLSSGERVFVSGVPGASKALLLKELKEKLFVVTPSENVARAITEDFKRFGVRAVFLPPWDVLPSEPSSPSLSSQYERLKSIISIVLEEPDVIVATFYSATLKFIKAEVLLERTFELKKGKNIDYDNLLAFLSTEGFRRVEEDPQEGEFVLKGNFFKLVFPEEVIEIELFEDTVERILVNGKESSEVILTPLMEVPLEKKILEKLEKLDFETAEKHRVFGEFSGAEKFLPYLYPLESPEEFTKDRLVVFIEPELVESGYKSMVNQVLKESGEKFFKDFFSELPHWKIGIYEENKGINFGISPVPPISEENLEKLLREHADFKVTVVCSTDFLKEKAEKLVKKLGVKVSILKGLSSGGFRLRDEKLAFLVEEGVVPETPKKKKDVLELEPGSFVVHRDYGIGIFKGVVKREIRGKVFDFVEIEYANGERLFAPFTQLDRIYPYGGKPLKLDKLGGTSWKNLERKIKASMLKFARELAVLYKERKTAIGERIIGDKEMIKKFEEKFPYRLTPDQAKAIRDVYEDMESDRPMDRLICGDVGYGKTEVAMRACMKAVSAGKQVAVICPTTVLADQHFQTFTKRFEGFPVRIELLSRFKTKKEQKRIIEELKEGKIDIVIGTHRLLQDDVEFKDLGLLVIDEEHKFGVRAKEKLTRIKKNLDVLYLSATPIPRTLYSALSGFRDISLLETPPPGRKGTKVVVSKYSEDALKSAVERELKREGQVFIVHNDISKLPEIKKVVEDFSSAVVEVVHGKMKPSQIEKIMHKFFEGEIDVLVSTVIVESGLDVPSANTLIVIGAENLGLSQLYQLKGRVGRGVERGYCYLFVSPDVSPTPQALKRLETMKKLPLLGGGFKLALKDLEIRGAGTLLGPKQSGFVKTLGVELYSKLLEEAVREEEDSDVVINLPFDAYIPEDFIEDSKERLKIYSELAKSKNPKEFLEELRKIKGFIPDPMVNMFKIMHIKKIAKNLRIKEITSSGDGVVRLKFSKDSPVDPEKLVNLVKEEKATLTPDLTLTFKAKTLDEVENFLEKISQ